jgi:uncharacterized protein with HEPN domain
MPLRDKRGYLWDMIGAARAVLDFTQDKTFADYRSDRMLRSAVEREFILMGEALAQLKQTFPDTARRISRARQIVAFRNLLVHAYANIASEIVWGVIEDDLPTLLADVTELLRAETENP